MTLNWLVIWSALTQKQSAWEGLKAPLSGSTDNGPRSYRKSLWKSRAKESAQSSKGPLWPYREAQGQCSTEGNYFCWQYMVVVVVVCCAISKHGSRPHGAGVQKRGFQPWVCLSDLQFPFKLDSVITAVEVIMKQSEAAYFNGSMWCATLCDLVFQSPLGNKLFILILEQCRTDLTS